MNFSLFLFVCGFSSHLGIFHSYEDDTIVGEGMKDNYSFVFIKFQNRPMRMVSKTKTARVHFCTKRKPHNDPCLHLNGNPTQVVKEVNFLGVSFVPHIKMLKENAQRLSMSSQTPNGVKINLLYSIFIVYYRSNLT